MQKTWRSHLMAAYSLAILAFLYLPLLILAMYSFNESGSTPSGPASPSTGMKRFSKTAAF